MRDRTRLDRTEAQRKPGAHAPAQAGAGLVVQAKLQVGAANDAAEVEADRVAAFVVDVLRSVRAAAEPAPAAPEAAADLQRSPGGVRRAGSGVVGLAGGDLDPDAEGAIGAARGGGRPPPDRVRTSMEGAFGVDFGGVRVHTGEVARDLNDGMQARAFTVGSDIFFRDGLPSTDSPQGQHLIAHELAHTVQQGASVHRLVPGQEDGGLYNNVEDEAVEQEQDEGPGPYNNVDDEGPGLYNNVEDEAVEQEQDEGPGPYNNVEDEGPGPYNNEYATYVPAQQQDEGPGLYNNVEDEGPGPYNNEYATYVPAQQQDDGPGPYNNEGERGGHAYGVEEHAAVYTPVEQTEAEDDGHFYANHPPVDGGHFYATTTPEMLGQAPTTYTYTGAQDHGGQQQAPPQQQQAPPQQQRRPRQVRQEDAPEGTQLAPLRQRKQHHPRLVAQLTKAFEKEREEVRSNLNSVIESEAAGLARLYAAKRDVAALADNDAVGLNAIKARFRGEFATQIAPLNREELLQVLTARHKATYEKITRQDVVVGEDGSLDLKQLENRKVEYDVAPEDQEQTLVLADTSGLLRRNYGGKPPVDTSKSVTQHSGAGVEIFVVGKTNDIHMGSHKIGKYHHSSLLAGGDITMGGEMKVTGGKIDWMSNKSGHYRPTKQHFTQFLHYLEKDLTGGVPPASESADPLNFKVMGWGIADGQTARQFLNGLAATETWDFIKTDAVWKAFVDEFGRDAVLQVVRDKGWQTNGSGTDMVGPDGNPVPLQDVRRALKEAFGTRGKSVRTQADTNKQDFV